MPAEIYEQRFVAVRVPAWHRLGTVFEEPVSPSQAVASGNLDVPANIFPLRAVMPDGRLLDVDLSIVGHVVGDRVEVLGTARRFEIMPLTEILPQLDELAAQYPLSATGTLNRGGRVFFTFAAGESEIVGEQYLEYLVYAHSYTPGVANLIMWTPVRVVCQNTLLTGEAAATLKLAAKHTRGVIERTSASLAVADALKRADTIKAHLEMLARIQMSRAGVENVLRQVYGPYAPRAIDLSPIEDLVDERTLSLVSAPAEQQVRYVNNLVSTAMLSYDRLCDEFPRIAGTAYAVYQAVVESADYRRGRSSSAESSVVGARADEKARAWKILVSLN